MILITTFALMSPRVSYCYSGGLEETNVLVSLRPADSLQIVIVFCFVF